MNLRLINSSFANRRYSLPLQPNGEPAKDGFVTPRKIRGETIAPNNAGFFKKSLLKGALKIKLNLLRALFKLGAKLITLSII